MTDSASDLKPLRLLYPGRCVLCGRELAKGADALHDSRLKTVRCVACPADGDARAEAAVDPGVAGASADREYERRIANRKR